MMRALTFSAKASTRASSLSFLSNVLGPRQYRRVLHCGDMEAQFMKHGKRGRRCESSPKQSLNLPDLDHAKAAVLSSLPSKESQRGYRHAIDEFIAWYCSEPRLSFNKAVVTRYRIYLESRQLAPGTINGRLAAVRRLAYEAADSGLLSPDLAAGISRVKGPKNLGVRLGNWLTVDQAKALCQVPDPSTLKGKRDRALLGVLLGCGLRRKEAAELEVAHLQRREDHWAIVGFAWQGPTYPHGAGSRLG
jgi:site-specific recombinase XerC